MNKQNYISAFTIMEAVISMAITAIVLSIVFVIFSFGSQRMLDFKQQNTQINDMTRMTYSLNKSIFENDKMFITADSVLKFEAYSGTAVSYIISKKYFVRNNVAFTDTFHISVKKIAIDTLNGKNEHNIYQRLKWDVSLNNRIEHFRFYKKIYPADLLKQHRHNEF